MHPTEKQLFIFDWDGSAVPDRLTQFPRLVVALSGLLEANSYAAVVTGNHERLIWKQLAQYIHPRLRKNLVLFTNRGSEIYGYSSEGQLILRHRRVAEPAEESALTSKSDSAAWIRDHLLPELRISPQQTVFFGDEFGPSEARAGIQGADYYSEKLLEYLEHQLSLRQIQTPVWLQHFATDAPEWKISSIGFDPAREREMESILALGNGYLGIRGSMDMPIPASAADLFISGVYDEKSELLPYSETEFLIPSQPGESTQRRKAAEIVPLPFPFRLSISARNRTLDFLEPGNPDHRSDLDMSKGLSFEKYHYHWPDENLSIRTLRCCSLSDPHLLLQEIELKAEGRPIPVTLDFSLKDEDFELNHPHLDLLEQNGLSLFKTRASKIEIAYGSQIHVFHGATGKVEQVQGPLDLTVKPRETLRVRRIISIFDSDGQGSGRAQMLAMNHLRNQSIADFDLKILEHIQTWEKRWEQADIQFVGNPSTTQAMRFNLYHLMIAAGLNPEHSIGARSLSGRAYGGHIFWDVEIFMLPFFVLNFPDIARKLLSYRHRTLDGARERARGFGCQGACYAWESTISGDDVTPTSLLIKSQKQLVPIFTGTQQIHISADIAYGIWNYWNHTLDDSFMIEYGAEILFETARFWISRSTWKDGQYHILGVVGPDEYHHSVNDNAFTNWMAHFNVSAALSCHQWLKSKDPEKFAQLVALLSLTPEEAAHWSEYLEKLHLPGPNEAGVIEQFEGFYKLKPSPLSKEDRFRAPYLRLLNWQETSSTQLVKQADVLMLFFLFPDRFSREVMEANYRYYEPLTDHASSLSPPVHATVAAQLGFEKEAETYFLRSLELDLQNLMSNTALGVHPACMGATWQALVTGFLGLRFDTEGFRVAREVPPLPASWKAVEFSLRYRKRIHPIRMSSTLPVARREA